MLTFRVPPGIGDFSAMYMKMCSWDREVAIEPSHDQPQRISPFLEILPKVKDAGYGIFGSGMPLLYTLPPGSALEYLPDGEYFLSINEWLESGRSAADWIPGPTNYHYEMSISEGLKLPANTLLSQLEDNWLVGIYTSAYGNSRHWGFWGLHDWWTFISEVAKILPKNTVFVFIGASFDVELSEKLHHRCMHGGIRSVNTLGQFHIGSTIELIRSLDYFFVFPSGLGFLADVVKTPHVMWFPEHLKKMMHTFTDPELARIGQTVHRLFEPTKVAVEEFKRNGMGFLRRSSCPRRSSMK